MQSSRDVVPRSNRSLRRACAGALLLAACCLASDELPPEIPRIDVQVFFSAGDARWPETDRLLDEVGREFPRLRIARTRIDQEEGRKLLNQFIKEKRVKEPGEVTLVLGPYCLINDPKLQEVQTYFRSLVRRIHNPNEGKGRQDNDPAPFVRKVFGSECTFSQVRGPVGEACRYFVVRRDARDVGFVVDAFRTVRCPMCNDAQFLVAVQLPDCAILAVRPIKPFDSYGRDMEESKVAPFVQQLHGRSEDLRERKVDGVTGATRTSNAYHEALVEILGHIKGLTAAQKPEKR